MPGTDTGRRRLSDADCSKYGKRAFDAALTSIGVLSPTETLDTLATPRGKSSGYAEKLGP